MCALLYNTRQCVINHQFAYIHVTLHQNLATNWRVYMVAKFDQISTIKHVITRCIYTYAYYNQKKPIQLHYCTTFILVHCPMCSYEPFFTVFSFFSLLCSGVFCSSNLSLFVVVVVVHRPDYIHQHHHLAVPISISHQAD